MSRTEWLTNRASAEARAATLIEEHHGPVMQMVAQAVVDLRPECISLSEAEADLRLAGEIAYRLDKAITLPNPILEALDGPVLWFIALGAVGIWRSIQRREKNRGAKLSRLEALLAAKGGAMSSARRRRVTRRVERLRVILGAE